MAIIRVPIMGLQLQAFRRAARLSRAALAHKVNVKPEVVEAWELGQRRPTVGQVRTLATVLRRTPAAFLVEGPPAEDQSPNPPDFRNSSEDDAGADLARELAKAADRRDVMIQLGEVAENELARLEWTEDMDASEAAAGLRQHLGVPPEEQLSWRSHAEALNAWISVLNDHGTLVFHMSRISKKRVGGASVYADPLPFIVLNGADTPSVRIFTLAHELGHLIARSGGICTLWNKRDVERRCNEFAAAFLMPAESFLSVLNGSDPLASLPRLARAFNVSYSAAAVRLTTLGLIDQTALDEQLEIASRLADAQDEVEASKERKGGPPFHRTHARNLGRLYLGTVLDALDDERVSYSDASVFLESKLPTIDKMRDDLFAPKGVNIEVFA